MRQGRNCAAGSDERGGRSLSTLRSLTIGLRGAILTLLLSPTLALTQAVDGEPEKLSNDQPSRPLQMPAASSETKEAFDDFERFVRRGAWERATKALYAIPEAQATRFVDGPDGFIIPVARKRRAVLAGLSPEGQAAYRLFYDADAKKLLDQAEGPAEQAILETLYSSYFLTSVGDNAADRLGDLYFEQGRFDHAAECWLAVFRERPDSELSPALMAVKAALALARAGRRAEGEAIRKEVAGRYADEIVTIGGRKAKAAEHIRLAPGDAGPGVTPASASVGDGPPPALAEAIAAAWQLRFGASVTAGMTPPEATQWEANTLSGAVPAVAIEGPTLSDEGRRREIAGAVCVRVGDEDRGVGLDTALEVLEPAGKLVGRPEAGLPAQVVDLAREGAKLLRRAAGGPGRAMDTGGQGPQGRVCPAEIGHRAGGVVGRLVQGRHGSALLNSQRLGDRPRLASAFLGVDTSRSGAVHGKVGRLFVGSPKSFGEFPEIFELLDSASSAVVPRERKN